MQDYETNRIVLPPKSDQEQLLACQDKLRAVSQSLKTANLGEGKSDYIC